MDRPASGPAAGPLLYGEPDLCPPSMPLRRRVPSAVANLLSATSVQERERLLRGMLHAIGFEWLSYGTVLYEDGRCVPLSFFTSHANPAWVQRYFAERYYEVDSRHQEVPCSGLPLVWDIDDLATSPSYRGASGQRRRFLDDFRASGIRSGIFFSLASPTRAHERTVLSLLSGAPNRHWIVDGVLGQALTLGLCVHEYLSQSVRLQPQPDANGDAHHVISAMQQDILHYLIQGQSDKQIAHRLQLSLHAVDYHMRQLRRRFSVRNRVQLASAARLRMCSKFE